MGAGTTANREAIEAGYSEDLGAFTTQTSFNHGEDVPLKIGTDLPSFPGTNVNISVYRIGYYRAEARIIPGAGALNVPVTNTFQCNPRNPTTGELSCSNWSVSYTIPGSSLPAGGIYEAVLHRRRRRTDRKRCCLPCARRQSRLGSPIRASDSRLRGIQHLGLQVALFRCLRRREHDFLETVAPVAVSFDRPQAEGDKQLNQSFGPDFSTVFWLEQQGYDVSYTDDVQTDSNLPALLNHKIDLVSGHSEYWSYNSFNNFKKARDAGVNIVCAERQYRVLADALRKQPPHACLLQDDSGLGQRGTRVARPTTLRRRVPKVKSCRTMHTTTRRDPGAPAGDPNAPPGGRIGPNEPENSLWGVMGLGDNDALNFNLTVPAGNTNGEFANSRFWRNTHISTTSPDGCCRAPSWVAGVGPDSDATRVSRAGARRRQAVDADQHHQFRRLLAAGCRPRPGQHAPPPASPGTSARSSTGPRAARSYFRLGRWSGRSALTRKPPA